MRLRLGCGPVTGGPRRSFHTRQAKPSVGVFALLLVAALSALSCLHDTGAPTGPLAGRFAVAPTFVSGSAGIVEIAKVRVILARPNDGSVALDTGVTVAPGADQVDLTLTMQVFSSSETFLMSVEFMTPGGEVAFVGGPVEVTTTTDPGAPPVPVEVQARYVGVGANAVDVFIITTGASVLSGQTVTLTAEARDASAQPIPGTPIAWSSLDPARATVPDPAVGQVLGGSERGIARIVAELLTGPADTGQVLVQPVPNTMTVVSGDGQTGPINLELPLPIVVQVTAADGLPVEGVTVDFQTPDGGSFSAASAVTDVSGQAQTSWILGPASGTQTTTASVSGFPGVQVTIAATAFAGRLVRWSNAAGGSWSDPANWDVGTIPGASDTAVIDLAGTYTVTLDVAASVSGLALGGLTGTQTLAVLASPILFGSGTVGANGVININNTGTVTFAAAFNNSGTVNVQSGALALNGGGDHGGSFTVAALATLDFGGGVHTVSQTGPVSVTGSLTVSGGSLDLGLNGAVLVSGDFGTTSSGVLRMESTAALVVAGNVSFGGGSTAGTLLGGAITVSGNFTQSGDPASFAAGPGHLVEFDVLNGSQTITFQDATNSFFGDIDVPNSASLTLASDVTVIGNLLFGAGGSLVGSGFTLSVGGDLAIPDAVTLATLRIGGVLDVPCCYTVTNTVFTGTGPQAIPFNSYVNLEVTGSAQFPLLGSGVVSGDLTVSGAGILDINGATVRVSGNFQTQNTALLIMNNGSSTLQVSGSTLIGGGNGSTTLTAGLILIRGDFTQSGDPESFHAGGSLIVDFDGTDQVVPQTITFTNPGIGPGVPLSHFANVGFNNTGAGISLASDVFAHSDLISSRSATAMTVFGNGYTLAVGGLNVTDLVLDRVIFEWNGTSSFPSFGTFTSFTNVTFINYLAADVRLTVIHPGGTFLLSNIGFTTAPSPASGGYYVRARDEDATTPFLTLNIGIVTPTPTCSLSGDFLVENNAVINDPNSYCGP